MLERMTDPTRQTVCVTGSTDGIGLATASLLLSQGHRVLVHARSEERGRPVLEQLKEAGSPADVDLVVADLAELGQVRALAERLRQEGLDVLIHNAGVWVRGDMPTVTADGFEATFGINVLAPHLLTALLQDHVSSRVLWLGSGTAASGKLKPSAMGGERGARQAYADSKAADVALAQAWDRRLTGARRSVAVDPGWVETKLASNGAPGHVDDSADSLAWLCSSDVGEAPYWKGREPIAVPPKLRDPGLQDAVADACDRLAGLQPQP